MSVDVMALVGVDVYPSYVSGEARGVHEPVIRESGCVCVCEIWRGKKRESRETSEYEISLAGRQHRFASGNESI